MKTEPKLTKSAREALKTFANDLEERIAVRLLRRAHGAERDDIEEIVGELMEERGIAPKDSP